MSKKSDPPTTSIIVVSHNSARFLSKCIDSVQRFTADYELIIVDNASTDGSVDQLLSSHGHGIRLYRNSINLGFARANNIGIRESHGKYIVLLNSDTVVTDGWLEHLVSCLERANDIGIVTAKTVRFDGKLDSTGHIFWFEYPEGKNRGENEPDLGQYDAKTELVSCDFACAIFRKTLFDRIGLLDESMFMYHEDIDFCVRARISGWRVIYCPNTLVYHWRGGSTTDVKKLKLWELRRRHLLRLALKDYQARNILRVLLYQGRQGIVAVIETSAGLLNRDLRYSALKLRKIPIMLDAIFWNIINFPMNERLQVQVTRKLADSEVFKREARRGALDPLIG